MIFDYKSILTFFLFCSILNGNLYAQKDYWQRTFHGPIISANNSGEAICQTTNDCMYVVGTTSVTQSLKSLLVLKLNKYGEKVWQKEISSSSSHITGKVVLATEDGGCIVSGHKDSCFAAKFDSSGNTVWYKNYYNVSSEPFQIIKTSNSNYLICGRDYYQRGFVIKIDADGNLIWRKTLFSSGAEYSSRYAYSIENSFTSGCLVTGYRLDSLNADLKMFVMKISQNGDSIWEKSYQINNRPAIGKKIIKNNNNYFIGCSAVNPFNPFNNIGFIKIDDDGGVLSANIIISDTNEFLNDFNITNSGIIWLVNFEIAQSSQCTKAYVTDMSNNIILEKRLTFVSNTVLNGFNLFSNNDFILTGIFFKTSQGNDTYVIRADNSFSFPPLSNISNNAIKISDFSIIKHYPNPFNDNMMLELNIGNKGYYQIEVFNILGKKMNNETISYFNEGLNKVVLSFKSLATGVYVINVTNGIELQKIKVVNLK